MNTVCWALISSQTFLPTEDQSKITKHRRGGCQTIWRSTRQLLEATTVLFVSCDRQKSAGYYQLFIFKSCVVKAVDLDVENLIEQGGKKESNWTTSRDQTKAALIHSKNSASNSGYPVHSTVSQIFLKTACDHPWYCSGSLSVSCSIYCWLLCLLSAKTKASLSLFGIESKDNKRYYILTLTVAFIYLYMIFRGKGSIWATVKMGNCLFFFDWIEGEYCSAILCLSISSKITLWKTLSLRFWQQNPCNLWYQPWYIKGDGQNLNTRVIS